MQDHRQADGRPRQGRILNADDPDLQGLRDYFIVDGSNRVISTIGNPSDDAPRLMLKRRQRRALLHDLRKRARNKMRKAVADREAYGARLRAGMYDDPVST